MKCWLKMCFCLACGYDKEGLIFEQFSEGSNNDRSNLTSGHWDADSEAGSPIVTAVRPRRRASTLRSEEDALVSTCCSGYQTFGDTSAFSPTESMTQDEGRGHQRQPVGRRTLALESQVDEEPSDEIDKDEYQSEISLTLTYSDVHGVLCVRINHCSELPAGNTKKNSSNPYVQVCLLPDVDKKNKRKSRTKLETLNPNYEESLFPPFELQPDKVELHTLRVTVFHSTGGQSLLRLVRSQLIDQPKVCLGEIFIPLTRYMLRQPLTRTYPLPALKLNPFHSTPRNSILSFNLGAVLVLLKFVPKYDGDDLITQRGQPQVAAAITPRTLGALEVRVVSAHGLPLRDSGQPPKPYCNVFLYNVQANRPSFGLKQKTPTEHDAVAPKWNHTLTFHNVTLDMMKECCLEISVMDESTKSKKEFVGGIRLSLFSSAGFGSEISLSADYSNFIDSTPTEREVWTQLLSGSPKKQKVEGQLMLRWFTPYDKIRSKFGTSSSGSIANCNSISRLKLSE